MHINMKHKKSYEINKRRRQIRLMLSHGVTEQELADKLGIDQSTISRDIKAINQMYQDQAEKHDMDYYYGQCSDKIQEAERLVWENYENLTDNEKKKYCCQTAKTIADLVQARFTILKDGPGMMRIKAINKRINQIGSE
jgi:IS30 family transposase